MKETFDKVLAWIKNNVWLSVGILAAALLLFFPKLLRQTRRRTRRRVAPITRRRTRRRSYTTPVKRAKRNYSRGTAKKKPWQIKGSLAAKRRMAQIRKRR